MTKKIIKNILFILLFFSVESIYAQYSEYEIKAQFIYKFTQYINWSNNSTVQDSTKPFTICVIGKSPIYDYLSEFAKNTKLKGKRVEVKNISKTKNHECNILFIPKSEERNVDKILNNVKGKGILTISEIEGCAQKGVIINFYLIDDKIHFEINNRVANENGFKISSLLLKLARIAE